MKEVFSVFIIVWSFFSFGQNTPTIQLTDKNLSESFANQSVYLTLDKDDQSVSNILKLPNEAFQPIEQYIANFDFTSKTYWVKFSVTNQTSFDEFYFEIARPITNKVVLYQVHDNTVLDSLYSGDDFPYYSRPIDHRKNIFELNFEKGDTNHYLLKMVSDGEMLFFPLYIHVKTDFYQDDFKVQFSSGFYYGILSIVIIIYFFFYLFLKDISYLFYVCYVLFQGLLQFSLDGYAHHHFFSQGGYLANHSLLIFASVTIIFLLLYVNSFLNLKDSYPKIRKLYLVVGVIVIISAIFSIFPGPLYVLAFPLVNFISLIAIVTSVIAIFYIRSKGGQVDIFFTIAFVVLISGAIIFILGNFHFIENKALTLNALKFSSAFEFIILSISMSNKYGQLQKEKNLAQEIAFNRLEEKNELMDEINIKLEDQVKERTRKIEEQNKKLETFNHEIVSSIKYAKRIQEAILPSRTFIKTILPDSFFYYKPKDVVSGDFYFVDQTTNHDVPSSAKYTVIAAVDCTGHGVPGAFLSFVGNNLLNDSLTNPNVQTPGETLDFINVGLQKTLKQETQSIETVADGMDMSLVILSDDRSHLMFAGANNPLYIIRKKNGNNILDIEPAAKVRAETDDLFLMEFKGNSQPIGNYFSNTLLPFTNHNIPLEKGDVFYLFSDGFADQFGGPNEKKFNYRRFREMLIDNSQKDLKEQEKHIAQTLKYWKKDTWQVDDILLIGVRV